MWQACPVCNGQGNNLLGKPCHVCNGHGIISTISGLPPIHQKTTTTSTTLPDVVTCWKHEIMYSTFERCPKCLEESNK